MGLDRSGRSRFADVATQVAWLGGLLLVASSAAAEGRLSVAPAEPAGVAGGKGISASASLRIQVIVQPRLQLRDDAGEGLSLSSNRGRVTIACDQPAACAARGVGGRGIVEQTLPAPGSAYTIAQP